MVTNLKGGGYRWKSCSEKGHEYKDAPLYLYWYPCTRICGGPYEIFSCSGTSCIFEVLKTEYNNWHCVTCRVDPAKFFPLRLRSPIRVVGNWRRAIYICYENIYQGQDPSKQKSPHSLFSLLCHYLEQRAPQVRIAPSFQGIVENICGVHTKSSIVKHSQDKVPWFPSAIVVHVPRDVCMFSCCEVRWHGSDEK